MADESLEKRLNYEYPFFEEYLQPKGALTIDRACHACFYYAMLAWKARGNAGPIDSQIIQYKVGEAIPAWRESRDAEIAQSVAIIYALESPEKFLEYKKEAWHQARLLGVTLPADIFRVRTIN